MITYHVGSVAQLHLAGDVHHPWPYLQPQKCMSEPMCKEYSFFKEERGQSVAKKLNGFGATNINSVKGN